MIAKIFATKFFAKILHLFHMAKSFYLLPEEVGLFQQAEGVGFLFSAVLFHEAEGEFAAIGGGVLNGIDLTLIDH